MLVLQDMLTEINSERTREPLHILKQEMYLLILEYQDNHLGNSISVGLECGEKEMS